MRRSVLAFLALAAAAVASGPRTARSDPTAPSSPIASRRVTPVGLEYLRALGPHASQALAPSTGLVGALFGLPPGTRAEDYGLDAVAPGIGRMRASVGKLDAFAEAHPSLRMEIAPPLHTLLDHAGIFVQSNLARAERGADGTGVLVGVADTGLDVTHPEFVDKNGHTRVAWLLDLSLEPINAWPELEDEFGLKDDSGKLIAGAVFSSAEIDQLLAKIASGACKESTGNLCAPTDEVGHGTHVAGIAAARGFDQKFPGIAPNATLVAVRVTRSASEGIENDDLVRAVQFMFDRADAEKKPMVVNMSLGSDFGPHDGTFLWEQTIAASVGPDHPGRAVVAAAGNSGSIVETPIHQSVHVTSGARLGVPVLTQGAENGSVQIWVTLRPGANVKIGLDGPDGEWIAPVEAGNQSGKNTSDYNAGVIFGSGAPGSPVPSGSNGAVVVWTGKWPSGTYFVTLEGDGLAELYLQGIGDADLAGAKPAMFAHGVREGTINLPATNPAIIGVGCTVNRPKWESIAHQEVGLQLPELDPAGGLPKLDDKGEYVFRNIDPGEVCWFSSAGPTPLGVPKPEIAAPGALVISAMSRGAKPGVPGSVFTNPDCPPTPDNKADDRCLQIDDEHGIAVGTSMSAPIVAGVVALLFQKDPTLTQDNVLALLQAGAHVFRGAAPFSDQSSPGEVDAMGSLDALDQMNDPTLYLPAGGQSWMTTSEEYIAADGSTPLTAILELRTADGAHRADFFDLNRLAATVVVDDKPVDPPPQILRRGPGVYFYVYTPPPGLGGSVASLGATFDGEPIVATKTLPIAVDRWAAAYPSEATGNGCSVQPTAPARRRAFDAFGLGVALAAIVTGARRGARRRSSR